MVFIVGLLAIIAIGLIHPLALHAAQPGRSLLPARALEPVSVLLLLKAFSAGCSALTGVEAIANGVPLFKPPRVRRAKRTELLLGVILGAMLLGLAVLASRWHIGAPLRPDRAEPDHGDGRGPALGLLRDVASTITVVLALAANTSFGGLPVLASLLARDNYLPHLFALRDDRQVFASGIWTLAVLSGALLVAVARQHPDADPAVRHRGVHRVHASQTGLVVHWRRTRPPRWRYRAASTASARPPPAVATVVFLVTKFTEGAWVVVLAVPAFIVLVHPGSPLLRPGRARPLASARSRPSPRPGRPWWSCR